MILIQSRNSVSQLLLTISQGSLTVLMAIDGLLDVRRLAATVLAKVRAQLLLNLRQVRDGSFNLFEAEQNLDVLLHFSVCALCDQLVDPFAIEEEEAAEGLWQDPVYGRLGRALGSVESS